MFSFNNSNSVRIIDVRGSRAKRYGLYAYDVELWYLRDSWFDGYVDSMHLILFSDNWVEGVHVGNGGIYWKWGGANVFDNIYSGGSCWNSEGNAAIYIEDATKGIWNNIRIDSNEAHGIYLYGKYDPCTKHVFSNIFISRFIHSTKLRDAIRLESSGDSVADNVFTGIYIGKKDSGETEYNWNCSIREIGGNTNNNTFVSGRIRDCTNDPVLIGTNSKILNIIGYDFTQEDERYISTINGLSDSTSTLSLNVTYLVPVIVEDWFNLTHICLTWNTPSTGNVKVGLYRANSGTPQGQELVTSSSGIAKSGTSRTQEIDVNDIILKPSVYYVAVLTDESTTKIYRPPTTPLFYQSTWRTYYFNLNYTQSLPSTCPSVTVTTSVIPGANLKGYVIIDYDERG